MTTSPPRSRPPPLGETARAGALRSPATREMKATLRSRAGDVRRSLDDARRVVSEQLHAGRRRPWPTIPFSRIVNDEVSDEAIADIRRHGCVVVTGTFPAATTGRWADDLDAVVERLDPTDESTRDTPGGGFVELFWTTPQLEARSHPHTDVVRRFLNGFWRAASNGRRWFDP